MEIRVVSSLTPDDEIRLAPLVLGELAQLLGRMPIAYDIRIQTTGDRVFSHRRPPGDTARVPPAGQ
jgi:hypothetical protein